MSIKLWFKSIPNPKLEEKLPGIGDFTRLFCSIKFRGSNGWSKTRDAIVDTGAPISVIPLDIWTDIENEILTEHEIQGINPRKECALPALIGKATCILLDEEGNLIQRIGNFKSLCFNQFGPFNNWLQRCLQKFTNS